MKIYYNCSTADFFTYEKSYFHIRDFLIAQGHLLTRDWLPHTAKLLHDGDTVIRDIKQIYRDNITALHDADLVIIEDTVSNFSTGHQITLALQSRKPTLVLWQGKKHHQFNQMFIHGIESDILQVSEYSLSSLDTIIKTFIQKYENSDEKSRFHLVLSHLERRYLDWAQFTTGKSRTQIIRDSLRQKNDTDQKYNDYLSKHN